MLHWLSRFILFCPIFTFANDITVRMFSVADGLSQSQVIGITQVATGHMVFATMGGGLSFYDGTGFENFGRHEGLNNEVINDMLLASDGLLFVATESGISMLQEKTFHVPSWATEIDQVPVWYIEETEPGILWFSTELGELFQLKNQKLKKCPSLDKPEPLYINRLESGKDGILLVGTDQGLFKISNDQLELTPVPIPYEDQNIYTLYHEDDGTLWVGTYDNLYRRNSAGPWDNMSEVMGKDFNQVISLLRLSDGSFWIGTHEGLFKWQDQKLHRFSDENTVPSYRIEYLYEDREGTLWCGTFAGLIQLVLDIPINNYLTTKRTSQHSAWNFFEPQPKTIWVATENQVFEIQTDTHREAKASLPKSDLEMASIYRVDVDLFLCAVGTTVYIQNSERVIQEHSNWPMDFDQFICSYQAEDGRVFLGTDRGSIIEYAEGTWKYYFGKDFPKTLINDIKLDSNGQAWLATDLGLYFYNFEQPPKLMGLGNKSVMNVVFDDRNRLWSGTYGFGVFCFGLSKAGELDLLGSLDEASGLDELEVQSIIFDHQGMLWIGTNSGVFRTNPQSILTGKDVDLFRFGHSEGVLGVECNQNAVLRDSEDYLWFGTIDGAVRIDPAKMISERPSSTTIITGVDLFFGTFSVEDFASGPKGPNGIPQNLSLPYHRNHLSFSFTGVNTTFPGSVEYSWFLEGLDQQWSPRSKISYVTYPGLPPGSYTFHVKSSTHPGKWQGPPALFSFEIKPPFWQETWFFVLLFFLGAGLLYLVYSIRIWRLKNHNLELEKIVHTRTLALEEQKGKVVRANAELEQRVKERTEELRIKDRELVQAHKMEAIAALAGGVAHDLNNILSGVVSYPELMALKMEPTDPNYRYLEIIKQSGQRAADIVQDLLTLTRKGVQRSKVICMDDLIRSLLESPSWLNQVQAHPSVKVHTTLYSAPLRIDGSETHLFKSILNLCVNALEAIEGSGQVQIETRTTRLNDPLPGYYEITPGEYVVVSVIDSGKGIQPEDLPQVFEPFFSKKKLGRSGTGLGMSVVWWTVHDHQGYIQIESKPGEGTKIDLYFPTSRKNETSEVLEKPLPTFEYMAGSEPKILVVDDEANQRELASTILNELSFQVTTVASGEEAAELTRTQRFDLAMLDMILGPDRMDGLDTFLKLRQFQPDIKAVIVSGYSESSRVEEALSLGVGGYLRKPYLRSQLTQLIFNELNRPLDPI